MTLTQRRSALRLLKPRWRVANERAAQLGLPACPQPRYRTDLGDYVGAETFAPGTDPEAKDWQLRLDDEQFLWRLWGDGPLPPWLPFFGGRTPNVALRDHRGHRWLAFISVGTNTHRAARWIETELTWDKIEKDRASTPPDKPIRVVTLDF